MRRDKGGEERSSPGGEGGAVPNDMYNTRILCPTVFARVIVVVSGTGGQLTIPSGTLLDESENTELIRRKFVSSCIGDDLVDRVQIHCLFRRVGVRSATTIFV